MRMRPNSIDSSATPYIQDFDRMIKCKKARYEFDKDGMDTLIAIINDAVAKNGDKRLESTALAPLRATACWRRRRRGRRRALIITQYH